MVRAALLALAAFVMLALPSAPAMAQGQCSFCGDTPPPRGNGGNPGNGGNNGQGRLDLTIQTDIDFGRLILVGNGIGSVLIDLQSGQKIINGGLNDLGGVPVRGQAVITGMPLKAIRITMPTSITMSTPGGGQAELRDFQTDLTGFPVLDANGQLVFRFTGTLYTASTVGLGGTLRGRIPIRVQYN